MILRAGKALFPWSTSSAGSFEQVGADLCRFGSAVKEASGGLAVCSLMNRVEINGSVHPGNEGQSNGPEIS